MEAAPSEEFTQHGAILAKLPDFGSLAMSKVVLAALQSYQCGHDLICLSSILSVVNTTAVLKDIPQNIKSSDGDFMTLLNIMNTVLSVKESVRAHQFRLRRVCEIKGLTSIQHIIGRALKRYDQLKNAFNRSEDFREKAQVRSGKWELIAKSLLHGYSDNVFISMKEIYQRVNLITSHSKDSSLSNSHK